jgi:hypothetical protein
LRDGLNAVIRGPAIRDPSLFVGVSLRPVTRAWWDAYPLRDDVGYLNEYLLEDAYPNELGTSVVVYYPSDRSQRGRLQFSIRAIFLNATAQPPTRLPIFFNQYTSPTDTELPDSVRCPLNHSSTWSWPEALRSHWYDMGVRDLFAANAVKRPEGLDQGSENFRNTWVAVENKLRELQSGIYGKIADSITRGPELEGVARELSGAKLRSIPSAPAKARGLDVNETREASPQRARTAMGSEPQWGRI